MWYEDKYLQWNTVFQIILFFKIWKKFYKTSHCVLDFGRKVFAERLWPSNKKEAVTVCLFDKSIVFLTLIGKIPYTFAVY